MSDETETRVLVVVTDPSTAASVSDVLRQYGVGHFATTYEDARRILLGRTWRAVPDTTNQGSDES